MALLAAAHTYLIYSHLCCPALAPNLCVGVSIFLDFICTVLIASTEHSGPAFNGILNIKDRRSQNTSLHFIRVVTHQLNWGHYSLQIIPTQSLPSPFSAVLKTPFLPRLSQPLWLFLHPASLNKSIPPWIFTALLFQRSPHPLNSVLHVPHTPKASMGLCSPPPLAQRHPKQKACRNSPLQTW